SGEDGPDAGGVRLGDAAVSADFAGTERTGVDGGPAHDGVVMRHARSLRKDRTANSAAPAQGARAGTVSGGAGIRGGPSVPGVSVHSGRGRSALVCGFRPDGAPDLGVGLPRGPVAARIVPLELGAVLEPSAAAGAGRPGGGGGHAAGAPGHDAFRPEPQKTGARLEAAGSAGEAAGVAAAESAGAGGSGGAAAGVSRRRVCSGARQAGSLSGAAARERPERG